MLIAIACVDKDGRIYADGTVPFRIQKDIDRFSYLTSGGILIYEESVLRNFLGERPMQGRDNIIISSHSIADATAVFPTVEEAYGVYQ